MRWLLALTLLAIVYSAQAEEPTPLPPLVLPDCSHVYDVSLPAWLDCLTGPTPTATPLVE